MIESICANCGNKKIFEEDKLGKKYKCPSCSNTVVIEKVDVSTSMENEITMTTEVFDFDKELKRNNWIGVGIGCVVPFILFMVVAFSYIYKEDGMGWTMGAPFIIAIGGVILNKIMNSRTKKKANDPTIKK